MYVNLTCEEERAQFDWTVLGSQNRPNGRFYDMICTHCKKQLFLRTSPRAQSNGSIPQQPSGSVDASKHMHINTARQGSLGPT